MNSLPEVPQITLPVIGNVGRSKLPLETTEGCSRSDKVALGVAAPVSVLWQHPTPQEQALEQVDAFLSVPLNRVEMKRKVARYGLTERHWALRYLRLWAAIYRIRDKRVLCGNVTESDNAFVKPKSDLEDT